LCWKKIEIKIWLADTMQVNATAQQTPEARAALSLLLYDFSTNRQGEHP